LRRWHSRMISSNCARVAPDTTVHPHRPRKSLGQHFLHQASVIDAILDAFAVNSDDRVLEIGPGKGALTRSLAASARSLDLVELDRDLARRLEEQFVSLDKVHVHQADALKFDFCAVAGGEKLRVIGNLPYNISTPLLFRLISSSSCIRDMMLMLQKEVVDRMVAGPGSRDYGRLSVMVQQRCTVRRILTVAPGAFTPPPKVESSVVYLVPAEPPPYPVVSPVTFRRIVQAAFMRRRKTMRNALRGTIDSALLQEAGINPQMRPEEVSVADYARLADIASQYSGMSKSAP